MVKYVVKTHGDDYIIVEAANLTQAHRMMKELDIPVSMITPTAGSVSYPFETADCSKVEGKRGTVCRQVFALVYACPICGAANGVPLDDDESPKSAVCSYCNSIVGLAV